MAGSKKDKQNKAMKKILQGGNPGKDRIKNVMVPEVGNSTGFKGMPSDIEVGDTWEDPEGYTWKLKEHGPVKQSKLMGLGKPTFCPECDGVLGSNKRDRKMWNIHGKCFDCVIEEQTQMRIDGTWEIYEKERILENMRSWLKECREELIKWEKNYKVEHEHIDQDGRIHEWFSGEDKDEVIQDYKDHLDQIENNADDLEEEIKVLREEKKEN